MFEFIHLFLHDTKTFIFTIYVLGILAAGAFAIWKVSKI